MFIWEWVQGLSGGAATVVGTATGSFLGLLTLLLGALYNARLNRKRDDRIRAEERRGVAAALRAELSGIVKIIEGNVTALRENPPEADEGFLASDLAQFVRVMPQVLPKIGLLDAETIRTTMQAYSMIDELFAKYMILSGSAPNETLKKMGRMYIAGNLTEKIIQMNEVVLSDLQDAIMRLRAFA